MKHLVCNKPVQINLNSDNRIASELVEDSGFEIHILSYYLKKDQDNQPENLPSGAYSSSSMSDPPRPLGRGMTLKAKLEAVKKQRLENEARQKREQLVEAAAADSSSPVDVQPVQVTGLGRGGLLKAKLEAARKQRQIEVLHKTASDEATTETQTSTSPQTQLASKVTK